MTKNRLVLQGEKVVEGIGIGVMYYVDRERTIPRTYLHNVRKREEEEFQRYLQATESAARHIQKAMEQDGISAETVSLLEAHRMMVTDSTIADQVLADIREHSINAEWAVLNVIEKISSILRGVDDRNDYYSRAKINDLQTVQEAIIDSLMDQNHDSLFAHIPEDKPVIICARSLTVGDLNELQQYKQVKGIALEIPGGVSHVTIVLRTLEIPAVLDLPNLVQELDYGDYKDMIIVNGLKGEVILRPTAEELEQADKERKDYALYFSRFLEGIDEPAISKDGYEMKIGGNIELPEDIPHVFSYGGDHIGLFRTEILYLEKKTVPDEDEQYQLYYQVLHSSLPHSVTVRIFDFGGDKEGHILHSGGVMGMRGIRFLPNASHIFDPQIRALIRVAGLGNLKIMLPFISAISEVDNFKAYLYRHAKEMGLIHHLDKIKIGAMIEVPAALFIAEQLATKVDFFSVGTNDLVQYMMAVERHDKTMSEYHSHFHPALIRALYNLSHISRMHNIDISICGEMGGDPHFTLLFMAMNISALSMSAHSIPIIKKIVKNSYLSEGKELLNSALLVESVEEMKSLIHEYMADRFPHIFYKTWTHTVEEVDS